MKRRQDGRPHPPRSIVPLTRVDDGRVANASWRQTPRQNVDAECSSRGRAAVVAGCIALLGRQEVDPGLVIALGAAPARWGNDGDARSGPDYWLRVWAARGLLWAWDDAALPSILAALTDEAWRVREMAAKVVARNAIGSALPGVAALRVDPVARVRATASRAVVRLTASGA
jgi:HEAT repeat protein